MSYCRREGKDIIIFATEDDLSKPSTTELLPDNPEDIDTSHVGAILPNGEINWDCPCLGNLPNGPCGSAFRGAFSCWVETREDQDAFSEKCVENFIEWEDCVAKHKDVYKPSKNSSEKEQESVIASSNDTNQPKESVESNDMDETIVTSDVKNLDYNNQPAIAAASVDDPLK